MATPLRQRETKGARNPPLIGHAWPVSSKQELARISARKGWKRHVTDATKMILESGKTLHLGLDTCGSTMTFFHRYFSVRSMKASDPHIMAVACLLLATKSEDQTRAVKDIVRNSWAARCKSKKLAHEASRVDEQQFYVDLREAVLLAEQALLYTFNFNVSIMTPYRYLRRAYKCFQNTRDSTCNQWWREKGEDWMQYGCRVINDSYDTTLCLQYGPDVIAAGCILLTLLVKEYTLEDLPTVPADSWDEQVPREPCPFWEAMCGNPAGVFDCRAQVMALYEPVPDPGAAGADSSATAATAGTAASAATAASIG